MHTVTVQTKFTFGDRVRFDSLTQRRSGAGKVLAIMIDAYGNSNLHYDIDERDEIEVQPGIPEHEITLLIEPDTAERLHTLILQTKFTFGVRVRFDSPTQGRSGAAKILAITIDGQGEIDYLIEPVNEEFCQRGILEDEITLLMGET